jgi:DNA-binding GntR family transcriptional regulator
MGARDREQLRAAARHCQESAAQGLDEYAISNFTFHDLLYRGSRNPFLEEQTRQTRLRVGAYRRFTLNLPGRLESSVYEHFQICDAIDAGDAERAHVLMLAHADIKRDQYAPFIAMIEEMQR